LKVYFVISACRLYDSKLAFYYKLRLFLVVRYENSLRYRKSPVVLNVVTELTVA